MIIWKFVVERYKSYYDHVDFFDVNRLWALAKSLQALQTRQMLWKTVQHGRNRKYRVAKSRNTLDIAHKNPPNPFLCHTFILGQFESNLTDTEKTGAIYFSVCPNPNFLMYFSWNGLFLGESFGGGLVSTLCAAYQLWIHCPVLHQIA